VLVDGRSLYLDFFGFVMWDFLPTNPLEIKQIEAVRGPGSAVWGANALSGVVNVITKRPKEIVGTSLLIGGGELGTKYASITHAGIGGGKGMLGFGYKISGGHYEQDAYERPPSISSFENSGTKQPKGEVRFDWDLTEESYVSFGAGMARTDGIIHTGIGPFDIASGSVLGYAKANYSKGAFKANAFLNVLNGDATNLISVGVTGAPLEFAFKNQTFDVELGNATAIGTTQVVSYGGNVRYNAFDLSIAPRGDSRAEAGFYVQDEIYPNEHVRFVIGGRVDKFDVLDHVVFSPRTAVLLKPHLDHTFRVSYNRAYRAPSLINNFLEVTLLNQLNLGLLNPLLAGQVFTFPIQGVGNEDLKEESLNAYEVSYTGIINQRATVTAAFYVNDTKNNIFFTQTGSYRATNPPPKWPLSPLALELILQSGTFGPGNGLPSEFSYRNFGKVRQKGFEIGVDALANAYVNVFANYSYQAKPKPTGFDISELNLPAQNLFNAGVSVTYDRWLGNLSLSYSDEAFWQDVLDSRFHGTTDSYTLVNAGLGYKWRGDKLVTSLKITNLGNQEIQQHVFGDIIKRQIVGEVRVGF
jgi:iron complex outermembrane receptor protein